MSDYFLLTYSVSDVGTTHLSKIKTDSVRLDIGSLKELKDLEELNYKIHRPFLRWEKLSGVETTIKGLMSTEEGSIKDKQKEAIANFSAIFEEILSAHNARSKTTKISCALMTESLLETIEFSVSIG